MRQKSPIRIVRSLERGLTLVELIVTVTILSILATAAVPVARFQVKRQNERLLRRDLWQMRDAIDHYKDAADRHAFITKMDSQGYPPDLDTMVKGVDAQGKKHDWRADITAAMAKRQRPDGRWVNEQDHWMESDPELVTGYVLMALSHCKHKK